MDCHVRVRMKLDIVKSGQAVYVARPIEVGRRVVREIGYDRTVSTRPIEIRVGIDYAGKT